jgi:flap endonuclease-1
MGIKNLMQIIKKYAPESIKYTRINTYQDQTIGIDANLMIYKLVYAIRKSGDIKNSNITVTHIFALTQRLLKLLKYNINAIFVFDGTMPDLKGETINKRIAFREHMILKYNKAVTQDEKKKYYYVATDITYKELQECRELISIFGFPIIEAPEEADSQLAYLSKNKIVDAIATDDMDILIFGGKKVLKNFSVSEEKHIQEINLEVLLKKLNMTQKQLIDLGILLGCDYCPDIKNVGTIGAYNLIHKYKTLDTVIKNKLVTLYVNYKNIQQYFLDAAHTAKIDTTPHKVDIIKLTALLKKYKFKKAYIKTVTQKIYDSLRLRIQSSDAVARTK